MRVLNRQKLQQKLQYKPRDWQTHVENNEKRINILDLGRRSGKSHYARYRAFRQLIIPHQYIWAVAPSYSLLGEIWDGIYFWALNYGAGWIDQIDKATRSIKTKHGSVLEFKSADNPSSLRGRGLDLLLVEEAAMIPDEIFHAALTPTISDKLGTLIAISTPRGSGWFKDFFYLGQSNDDQNKEYFSLKLSTQEANPDISSEEIEERRRTMPADIFRQEYLAEFIMDGGAVFRGIHDCATAQLEDPIEGVEYDMSADLAKHEDFTVLMVARRDTHQVVHIDRFNDLSWPVQKQRIISLHERYNHARVIIDSTGVGDVIYDDLWRQNIELKGYKFTNQSKTKLVENLIAAIDDKTISYPNDAVLLQELELYGYKITPSKNIQYGAPIGHHDDAVTALMLINELFNEPGFYFAAF